eukprot:CAMPEP_0117626788 /NCGR_PEP_ID=MMETSP0802-20121206/1591_1 /TAXON_ID=38833 /ORGANISM="Micromonas sp., Strain CCMP2099" /LENGTH=114 /DNA_ID=CAMNT_0005430899 /DNA_START=545 /DNA_END=889 /DNA_ORIENTATION=-
MAASGFRAALTSTSNPALSGNTMCTRPSPKRDPLATPLRAACQHPVVLVHENHLEVPPSPVDVEVAPRAWFELPGGGGGLRRDSVERTRRRWQLSPLVCASSGDPHKGVPVEFP